MKVQVTPRFQRTVKKLFAPEKAALDSAVRSLMENPLAGEQKKGDLAGVRVYKYKHAQQVLLLAYVHDAAEERLILLAHGTHENFYRDLKQG